MAPRTGAKVWGAARSGGNVFRDFGREADLRHLNRCEPVIPLWACSTQVPARPSECVRSWRSRTRSPPLRANIAETLLVPLITEQGGKEIQHEEYEDILSGPVGRAQ